MILSNVEIHRAIDAGRIRIQPEPTPRTKDGTGDCPYQTTAVDLRLGNEISYFKQLPITIDLRRGGFADLFGPNSESYTLTEEQPYVLQPNRLVLAKTMERVTLPLEQTGDHPLLAARVEGKSSYARCGLLVHFTAPTIHTGFSGTITLELINLGPHPISLFPMAPICQLIFEEVSGTPFRNDSQFHGQVKAGGKV